MEDCQDYSMGVTAQEMGDPRLFPCTSATCRMLPTDVEDMDGGLRWSLYGRDDFVEKVGTRANTCAFSHISPVYV